MRYPTARNGLLFVGVSMILGFAVAIGYRPELLPPGITRPVERIVQSFGQQTTVLAAGGLLALLGLVAAWVWGESAPTGSFTERSVSTPTRDVSVTGASMTERYENHQHGDDNFEDPITASLRETLIRLYRQKLDEGDAAAYVDTGEWTTDRVAAATLTAENAVDFPVWYRLYEWLYPDHAYRYRIRRTLGVVEATAAAELTAFTPPDRTGGRLERLRTLFRTTTEGDR